jgi:hypothetical protein
MNGDDLLERLDHLAEHIGDEDYHVPLGSKSAVLLAIKEIERLRDENEQLHKLNAQPGEKE